MAVQKPALGVPKVDFGAAPDEFTKQLNSFWDAKGVDHRETPYWQGKQQEMRQRGVELGDPEYGMKRVEHAEVLGGPLWPSEAPQRRSPGLTPMAMPQPLQFDLSPLQMNMLANIPGLAQLLGTSDPQQVLRLMTGR